MHISNLVKIHWIYSSYCPETKIQMYCGQKTLTKIDEICPSAIPNQISTISIHIWSVVKIHWDLLKLSSENLNTDLLRADNSVKNWQKSHYPKPDLYISMHRPSLVKIHWYLLKFSSRNENTDRRTDVRQIDGHKDNQHYTIIPLPLSCVGYKNQSWNWNTLPKQDLE